MEQGREPRLESIELSLSHGGIVEIGKGGDMPEGAHIDLGIIAPEGPSAAVYLTQNEALDLVRQIRKAAR